MKKIDFSGVLITFLVAGIMTLVSFYFSGFAPKASVDLQFSEVKAEIKAVDTKQDAKFDKILSGFCIIDKRTCQLKEK